MKGDAYFPFLVWERGRATALCTLLALLPFVAACDPYNQLFGSAKCDTLAISGIPALMQVGDTAHLRVYLRDRQLRTVQCTGPGRAVWSTTDPTILTVIGTQGDLVARTSGVVTITARTGEMTARTRIEVATQ